MIALALVAVLSTPPSHALQTLDLARLAWPRALALQGRTVRVRLVVLNRPVWFDDDTVLVKAEGPEEESRTVRVYGADHLSVDAGDELTVEGTLRVTWHRGRREFPGFV